MKAEIHQKNGDIEVIEVKDTNQFIQITRNINQYGAFISNKLYIPKSSIVKVALLEQTVPDEDEV